MYISVRNLLCIK